MFTKAFIRPKVYLKNADNKINDYAKQGMAMNSRLKLLSVTVSVMSLCACAMVNPNGYTNYQSYNYEDLVPYAEGTSGPETYQNAVEDKKQVFIPNSYHVGAYHSPASFKDRDRTWVSSQNPQAYTIELAEGDKASYVAGKLFKAPKTDRAAQVSYQKGNQSYYKGLYGSYASKEAAEQVLASLPDEVKSGAQVKSWASVQSVLGQ